MIQIVKGTYGFLDSNGTVKPKTAADGPFELTEAQEARLVNKRVAIYVDGGRTALPEGVECVTWNVDMKADQLRAIAKDMGLTFPVGTTKAAMVEAMDNHMAAVEADAEATGEEYPVGDDVAPVFNATEAVS